MLAGIEAGGTKFICAVAEHPAYIRDRIEIPTTTPAETFAKVRDFLSAQRSISAIGIAAFGPVDLDKGSRTFGHVLNTPKPGWTGANYKAAFAGFNVPIRIETDVSGACLGEYLHGAGQRLKTLAYVTVGTGIGAGIVQHGEIRNGAGHYEMGHIAVWQDIQSDPFRCHCPFHEDCLEGLASGPAIKARWGKSLSELGPGHVGFALEADYLAQLALAITLMHRPDAIIFGGGVMQTPDLLNALRRETANRLGGYLADKRLIGDLSAYIVPPALGGNAGITGALALARSVQTR
ncbi:MAG: ROK family protein [Henriciella sp.]